MASSDTIRIDKFLWAVRLFKTRSIAAEACKNNRVVMDGVNIKSSRLLKAGDEFHVKRPPVLYHYKVKGILKNRVGAKLVPEYLENLTTESELLKLELDKLSGHARRDKGTGRPTKKDRRELDDFTNM